MRITSKGQVTIPADIRERAGLLPNTEVTFRYDGKVVTLVRGKTKRSKRGARLIERLKGSGDVKMTTDQIMALMRGR